MAALRLYLTVHPLAARRWWAGSALAAAVRRRRQRQRPAMDPWVTSRRRHGMCPGLEHRMLLLERRALCLCGHARTWLAGLWGKV